MKKIARLILPIALVAMLFCFAACGTESPASAYDVAVANGYTGNVAQWLASLKGQDITVEDVYNTACDNGYEGTILEFLAEYLSYNEGEIALAAGEQGPGISQSLLASVSVKCSFEYLYGWGPYKTTREASQAGSGVIYQLDRESGDAYIITNYHVVYYYAATTENCISDSISVFLYGKEYDEFAIPATYLGGSMEYDIAVLKISGSEILKNSAAVAITPEDSNTVTVGTTAIAIGNAEGEGISVTRGIVSVDSESITMTAADNASSVTFRLLRVDTAINEGNSGGGLFDSDGELIGIVNAKVSSSTVENIGYAIPSNVAVYVAQNIIDNCDGETNTSVYKCMLGVGLGVSDSSAYYDTETETTRIREVVSVSSVSSGSLAEGKLKTGDIITAIKIDDTTYDISRSFIVIDILLNCRVGDTVTISVIRDGEAMEVVFTLTDSSLTKIS